MKILITGGAGFIGSHLADAYLADGHEVAIVDNLETGFRENINPDARFYECDIRDESTLAKHFDEFRPDLISHHAAQMSVRLAVADPNYDVSVNITGALNVLLNAVRVGAKRLIFASSGGAVYGEPQYLPVDENHPIEPESPYGLTKFAFEHYLRIWSHLHEFTPVVLRYANVYGPRQTPHGEAGVVAIFAGRLFADQPCIIFGDGTMTRDYVHVDDIVAANRAALEKGDNATVNIGSGVPTSTGEVFEAVRAAAGQGPAEPIYKPERPGEVHHIYLANERARVVLGWTPQIEFREGVRRTVEYLRGRE
jgi:UDP-glucose 4-epimerase